MLNIYFLHSGNRKNKNFHKNEDNLKNEDEQRNEDDL